MESEEDLVEQKSAEFSQAWSAEQRPDLGKFLLNLDSKERQKVAERLIAIDIRNRIEIGQAPAEKDYAHLDTGLRAIVERLLNTDNATLDVTLDSGVPVDPDETRFTESPAESKSQASSHSESDTIGPYNLIKVLGEGGMGTVWLAEQTEPVRRHVAVKVIKAGMDTERVVARFEAERQALAMMSHPYIAKVFDAGKTRTGQPFFAMELVDGVPFNTYCDKNKLSITERLQLFIPVCQAVQHAHQKGIIHRDLKPSNILICLQDGKPVPKVIDFGLAKALEQENHVSDKSAFTQFGQVVGTLQYMSPEQAELDQLDVDTRADVYSLGVMLYELMTGSTPIEQLLVQKGKVLKVLAAIRDLDPPRPSDRLSSSTEEAVSGISLMRQVEPSKLKSILRGDIDWIVMKALARDRDLRYDSASSFADDIGRYLSHEPIEARPPSKFYRAKKFARKNKGLLASIASIVALLVVGVCVSSWLAYAASVAKKEAQAATNVAIEEREKAETEKERADQAAESARAQSQIAWQTLNSVVSDVEKLATVSGGGQIRRKLLKSALTNLGKVEAAYVDQDSIDRETMIALASYGDLVQRFGNDAGDADSIESDSSESEDLALSFQQQSLAMAKKLAARDPNDETYLDLASAYSQIGTSLLAFEKPKLALVNFEKSRDTIGNIKDRSDSRIKSAMVSAEIGCGKSFNNMGELEPASLSFKKAVEIGKKLLEESGGVDVMLEDKVLVAQDWLSSTLLASGKIDQAIEQMTEVVAKSEKQVAADPTNILHQHNLSRTYARIGECYLRSGRLAESLEVLKKKEAISNRLIRDDPSDEWALQGSSSTLGDLATVYAKLGKIQEAKLALIKRLELNENRVASRPNDIKSLKELHASLNQLGGLLDNTGASEEARKIHYRSLEISEELVRKNPQNKYFKTALFGSYSNLVTTLTLNNEVDEAFRLANLAIPIGKDLASIDESDREAQLNLSIAYNNLGNLHRSKQQFSKAAEQFNQSLKIRKRLANLVKNDRRVQRSVGMAIEKLAELALVQKDYQTAVELYLDAIGHYQKLVKESPNDIDAKMNLNTAMTKLADSQVSMGDLEEAEEIYLKSLEVAKELAESNPNNPNLQRALFVRYFRLGVFNLQFGKPDETVKWYEKGIAVLKEMIDRKLMVEFAKGAKVDIEQRVKAIKSSTIAFGDWETLMEADPDRLPDLLEQRALRFESEKKFEKAARAAKALAVHEKASETQVYNSACILSLCIASMGNDSSEAQTKQKRELEIAAVAALKRAIKLGFDDFDHLKSDSDLDALKDLESFKELITAEAAKSQKE